MRPCWTWMCHYASRINIFSTEKSVSFSHYFSKTAPRAPTNLSNSETWVHAQVHLPQKSVRKNGSWANPGRSVCETENQIGQTHSAAVIVRNLAVHHGRQNPGLVDVLRGDLEQVLFEHDEVGELADLDRADLALHPDLP